jgi:hypothetical protein
VKTLSESPAGQQQAHPQQPIPHTLLVLQPPLSLLLLAMRPRLRLLLPACRKVSLTAEAAPLSRPAQWHHQQQHRPLHRPTLQQGQRQPSKKQYMIQ